MLRDVAEPGDAGGFEGDVGIQAARDGAVDDGLLLLVEQRHQLLLRPNRPLNPPVRVVEKPHDGGLLVRRWDGKRQTLEIAKAEVLPKSRTKTVKEFLQIVGMKQQEGKL